VAVYCLCQVVNCKVGVMKSQKDTGGLFALVTMEKPDDVHLCITKLNQTLFLGRKISVMKVRSFHSFLHVLVIVSVV